MYEKEKWKCPSLTHVQLFATLWDLAPQAPPCPWNSPGKSTGVDCHFLLQGIFPTQGSNSYVLFFTVWARDTYLKLKKKKKDLVAKI